jgi:hypothetical protein
MICTIQEYIELTEKDKDKRITARTVIRHIKKGLLPTNHVPHQLPIGNGIYIIEIKQ